MSVVEVLVALMLVTIGLLGIAGSTALTLRTTLDSMRRREATERAATRFALIAAGGCAAARSGFASDQRQLSERWTVAAAGNHFALVSDSILWMSARGPRSLAIRTAIQC